MTFATVERTHDIPLVRVLNGCENEGPTLPGPNWAGPTPDPTRLISIYFRPYPTLNVGFGSGTVGYGQNLRTLMIPSDPILHT